MAEQTPPLETRVVRMKLSDLKLLPLNARYMRHETFRTLVENLRRDRTLTQIPFAALDPSDGKYLVLSGNHRVKAGIEAGIEEDHVQITDQDLPEQRQVAIQLSHNAIVGEDDPAVLAQLYDRLDEVDWRSYSGLDDRTLGLLEQVDVGSLSEANLDFTSISLTFLPDEAERAVEVFHKAREMLSGDEVWLARWAEYDRALDALEMAGKAYKVSNTATSLMLVLDVFERHVRDLQDGYLDENGDAKHDGFVPLVSLFGHGIPAGAAMVVKRALAQAIERDEVTEGQEWQLIERLVAEYLAGP